MLVGFYIPINAEQMSVKTVSIGEPVITFGEDFVSEHLQIIADGHNIDFIRTSREDGTATLRIVEDGETISTQVCTIDYLAIWYALSSESLGDTPTTFDRTAGYDYIYIKSDVRTAYFTPENGKYSSILSMVSAVLSPLSMSASLIAAVASLIYSHSSAPVETKMVYTMTWYDVTLKNSPGDHLYFQCEYYVDTYAKNTSSSWTYLGRESDYFTSDSVY